MKTHGIGCWKKSYSKKAHAEAIAASLLRREGESTIWAYKCPRCGRFHVGHNNRFPV